ncbi:MAG: cysteine peptidase family C39 domain-containing protein [Gammaproteobacteria bacterium]
MKRFRLLKQTRQSTEYSCGAACLQSMLSCWGRDLDEEDLITLLHTTPETGTYPDDIVRVAKKYNGCIINQRIIPSDSLARLVLGQLEI